MPVNLFPQEILNAMDVAAQSAMPGTCDVCMDVNRTDTYVEDGTPDRPFKDLNDAVDFANANATAAHPYQVLFGPGVIEADPVTVSPYVKLQGAGWLTTVLKARDLTAHFITLVGTAVLRDVCVWGPTTDYMAAIHVVTPSSAAVGISEVAISRGYYGLLCDPVGSRASVLVQNLIHAYAGNTVTAMARVEGYGDVFVLNSTVSGPADSVETGFSVTGTNAVVTVINCFHQVAGAATVGGFVDNGAMLRVISSIFEAGHAALKSGSGADSRLRVQGSIIHRDLGPGTGYTHDLDIGSATTTVTFGGFLSRDRITNPFDAIIYGNGINHEDGFEGAFALGELVVGTDKCAMPLLSYGKGAYLTGLVSGGEVEIVSGLNIKVKAGDGFINSDTLASPIAVSWLESPTFAMTNNSTEYVYVDRTSTICKNTIQPDYGENIVLGQAVSYNGNVVLLTQDEIQISHTASRTAEFFEDVLGPLTADGCNVQKHGGNSYKFDVNAGTFMVGLSEREIDGILTGAAFTYVWQSAPGVWVYTSSTVIDKDHYDNGTGPTVFAGSDWKKDAVYLVVNQGGEQYFVVMGQAPFADQATALAGALPTPPDILRHYALRCAAIVTHAEAADIDTVVDIRPFLTGNAPVTAAVPTAHTDTTARDRDDNHTQYLTSARAVTWLATQPGNTTNLVSDGDNHSHDGVTGGAQITHGDLADIGTTTHADLDAHVASTSNPHNTSAAQVGAIATGAKGAASGVASLNGSTKVVEDPANATVTPTAGKIPIADGSGKLDGWITASGVTAVGASAPVTTTGGTTPTIGIDAASGLAAGSMSSTHFTLLNNATATPTASRIVVADASAKVDGWVSSGALAATPSLRALGSGATDACAGNDARLTNDRAPTNHATKHVTGGGDVIADAVAAGNSGLMSGADKTKLVGIAAGATVNVFGNDNQYVESLARVTFSTNTSFQTKSGAVLTTPAGLTGSYYLEWAYVLDNSATNQQVEAQCYNVTDAAILGGLDVMRPANSAERKHTCGFAIVTMAGVSKSFSIQYRTANTGATVGISEARLRFYRYA